jgi:hypothetical protein
MLEREEAEQQRGEEAIEVIAIKNEKEKQNTCKDVQDKTGTKLVLIKCY